MKIYWSGAAIALLADIELRERSGGKESLDVALDRLQHCCLPSKRKWSGPDLFTKLDSLVNEPVFMPMYKRYANKAGFPDVQPVLKRLGVDISGNKVRLLGNAELADIRTAIEGQTGDLTAETKRRKVQLRRRNQAINKENEPCTQESCSALSYLR